MLTAVRWPQEENRLGEIAMRQKQTDQPFHQPGLISIAEPNGTSRKATAPGMRICDDQFLSLLRPLKVQSQAGSTRSDPSRLSTRFSADPLGRSGVPFCSGTFLPTITVGIMIKVVSRVSPEMNLIEDKASELSSRVLDVRIVVVICGNR